MMAHAPRQQVRQMAKCSFYFYDYRLIWDDLVLNSIIGCLIRIKYQLACVNFNVGRLSISPLSN